MDDSGWVGLSTKIKSAPGDATGGIGGRGVFPEAGSTGFGNGPAFSTGALGVMIRSALAARPCSRTGATPGRSDVEARLLKFNGGAIREASGVFSGAAKRGDREGAAGSSAGGTFSFGKSALMGSADERAVKEPAGAITGNVILTAGIAGVSETGGLGLGVSGLTGSAITTGTTNGAAGAASATFGSTKLVNRIGLLVSVAGGGGSTG